MQALHDDLQVQLAHAPEQALARLRVFFDLEGRVLLFDLVQGLVELVWVCPHRRLDGQAQDRRAQFDALQAQGVSRLAEGVAGGGVTQPGQQDDLSGGGDIEFGLLAGIHLEDARHLFAHRAAVRGADLHRVAGAQAIAVDAGEDVPPPLPHLDLEGEGDQGSGIPQGDGLGAAVRAGGQGRGTIQGRREEVDDTIQQGLDAEVAQRAAAVAGAQTPGEGPAAQRGPQGGRLRLAAAQDQVGEGVVVLRGRQEQGLAVALGGLPQVRRAGFDQQVAALVAGEADQGAVDQVQDGRLVAGESGAEPIPQQGYRQGDRLGPQAAADVLQGVVEVRPGTVHLVDEKDHRELEAGALTPHRLGLGLHTPYPIEDQDAAVEDAHGSLHLDGKIHVPRGIDDLEGVVAPGGLGHRRGDGDPVLLLLDHVIHVGGALVDLADLVRGPGVVEDALRQRGLAGVHMGRDADVADMGEFCGFGHCLFQSTPCLADDGLPELTDGEAEPDPAGSRQKVPEAA